MNRILLAIVGSGVVFATVGRAQTPDASRRVTVSGCVERAQRNGSLAGTDVGATASPNTAPTAANSGELLNVFLLTDAGPADPANARASGVAPEPKRYALEGHEQELAKYVSQRVEVTGSLAPPRSSGRGETQNGLRSGVSRINIESLKPVAHECSANKR